MGFKEYNTLLSRLAEEILRLRILQEKGAPVHESLRSARTQLAKLLLRPSDAVASDSPE